MRSKRPRLSRLLLALALSPALLLSSWPHATAQQSGARGLDLKNQPPQPLAAGRFYALVIGNNNYQYVRHLQTAEADAREVEKLLSDSYGFQTRLLLNATRGQIISALAAYRRELAPEANLLIYYAGHGYNDPDADKAYWLPVDASKDDPANWISADDITTTIRVIPARHVLIVSDSCYSGTLTREIGAAVPASAQRQLFLQKMMQGRSRTLMASGGNEPVADGGGSGHSVFAAALLRGLREMDKGQFTAAELFRNYVEESVAGGAQQTPEYNPLRNSGHEAGDFVFIKLKVGDKTVEVTVSAPPAARVDPAQQELAFWSSMQTSTDAEDFKDYLARYPNGLYAGLARRKVTTLTSAVHSNTNVPEPSTVTSNPATSESTKATVAELIQRAAELYDHSRYDEAISTVTEAIRLDPQNAQAYSMRAMAYFQHEDYATGTRDVTQAFSINPQSAYAYTARCRGYAKKDNFDQAIQDCSEAIRLDPTIVEAYFARGWSYYQKRDSDQAIRDYTEVIRLNPKFEYAYYSRGDIYVDKGEYDQAIRDYTESIRLGTTYAYTYYARRGDAYLKKGDYDQAIKDYTEAIRLKPWFAEAYYNRAVAYERTGQKDRAKADRQKAQELLKK